MSDVNDPEKHETLLKLTFNEDSDSRADVMAHNKVVVCYLGTWATYRPNEGAYDLDKHFDPKLCTHLIYSFAGLDNQTNLLKPLDPYLDLEDNYGRGWFKKATTIKQKHPHLKILLAIGGWNEGSAKYSEMAKDSKTRKIFIASALETIRKYGFDGLDMDWEYPARRSGAAVDKKNFVKLLQELRQEFDQYGLMLTAAVGATQEISEESYDLPAISKVLDQVHLMCYDYFGSWDARTYHNAPLHAGQATKPISVAASIAYYLSQGVDPNKLVLGLPMYGRTFLLKDPAVEGSGLDRESLPNGFQGPFTREDGFLGFNEICKTLASDRGDWKTYWDPIAKVPYMRNGAKWVTFDSPASLMKKVEYGLSYGLKGAMVWSIDTDDFTGMCGDTTPYPLLRAINYALANTRKSTPGKPSAGSAGPSRTIILNIISTAVLFMSTTFLASQM
jgi:chitinase